ncbi:sulfite exporter TauE/SafE family protein [Kiloniella sp.]|uniref:sulfite exporter TauE/SafE family protein n=1 Tax=Kiloniella sp. TaxID=1938587 RepID=UPI003A906B15
MEIHVIVIIAIGTFLVSSFNAAIGPTGGIQLALVASLLPPQLSIPVHAVISGTSSLTRFYQFRSSVDWFFVLRFCLGSIIGTSVAIAVFFQIDEGLLLVVIGSFVLFNNYIPYKDFIGGKAVSYLDFIIGLITGALTVFVGATGPAVFTYIAASRGHREAVLGTDAACMSFQHFTKVIGFSLLAFLPLKYLSILIIFGLCGIFGTAIGVVFVRKMPEIFFRAAFRFVTTLVGVYLIGLGLWA